MGDNQRLRGKLGNWGTGELGTDAQPEGYKVTERHAKGPAIEVKGVRFSYNGWETLKGIDLRVERGEFVAVMGRNGAGKSTLLKQCIGLLKPRTGMARCWRRWAWPGWRIAIPGTLAWASASGWRWPQCWSATQS